MIPGDASGWDDTLLACRLYVLDPAGMVLHVKSAAGPARDALLGLLRAALPVRRCPLGIGDDRLLGGLDLSATLALGHRVAQRGLLAECDGGLMLLPMAERLTREAAARFCSALDHGEMLAERDGVGLCSATRIGVVLLDEGIEDEAPPAALLERAVFRVVLDGMTGESGPIGELEAARALLARVRCGLPIIQALCETAQLLGIASLRAPMMALRVARAAAALAGREAVTEADATLAARLVLAWRATSVPAAMPEAEAEGEQQAEQEPEAESQDAASLPSDVPDQAAEQSSDGEGMSERVVEAILASLPRDLLDRLQGSTAPLAASSGGGRSGEGHVPATQHGRPLPARAGRPERGKRLAVVETLRAAAPWQKLRRAARAEGHRAVRAEGDRAARAEGDRAARAEGDRVTRARRGQLGRRVEVRLSDFRIAPRAQTPRSIAIFVVDASGSAALNRLAEAKGAIERLLGDCYVRRDRVALIAFRGRSAEILLPPTGALTRARRSLAGLPGGGGTPLAAGIEAAMTLALDLRHRGETPLLVLLTDGRANITRAGIADRTQACEEAELCASRLRTAGLASLLVDISPRAEVKAQTLAARMGALYLKLPDAETLSRAVREAGRPEGRPEGRKVAA